MKKFYQKIGAFPLLIAIAVCCHASLFASSENGPAAFSFTIDIVQNQDISCAGGNTGALTASPTAGTAPFTYLWSTGAVTSSISGLSAGTYTVTVTDDLGVAVENSFEITEPAPIAVGFNITPTSDCTGPGTGAVTTFATGGTGTLTYDWSTGETTADLANLEAGTYTLTTRDDNNCENISNAVVHVLDVEAPVVAVKTLTVALDENGTAQVPVEDVDDGSSDNCGIVNATLTKTDFDCADLGENALTYTVFDAAGNSTAEEAIIIIIDEIAPVAIAADMTLSLGEDGFAYLDPNDVGAGSTDNCTIVSRTLSVQEFSCLDIGKVDVVLTVTDADGNSDETTFSVDIEDNSPPTIEWIEDAVLYLNENGFAFATYNALIESTNDNCGIEDGGFEVSTFTCEDVGFNDITYGQIDFHGNGTSHTKSVLVLDTIKPKFALQEIDIDLDAEGNASLTEEMLLPFATDNCGIAEVAIQNQSYNCSQIGETETQIIVFDMNGNFFQRTLFVMVNDPFTPEATAQDITVNLDENGEATITPEMVSFVLTDNCDQMDVSLSQSSFNCADGPTTNVVLTVTDNAGNTSEAPFTVTLLDQNDPEIICSGPITRCEGIFDPGTLVMAFDNCGYSVSQESGPGLGSLVLPGTYEIVYTATDNAGNSATCAVPLNVMPQPSVELGEDFSVEPGALITLSANQFEPGFTYLWSTGETTPTIQVQIFEQTLISVTVSAGLDCIIQDKINISTSLISSTSDTKGTFGIGVYPNPSRDVVNVELGIAEIQSEAFLTLVDLNGRLVFESSIQDIAPGQVLSLDISAFAKGLYVLSIQTESAVATAKIVKE